MQRKKTFWFPIVLAPILLYAGVAIIARIKDGNWSAGGSYLECAAFLVVLGLVVFLVCWAVRAIERLYDHMRRKR
jgi:uncharacterized protein HemY